MDNNNLPRHYYETEKQDRNYDVYRLYDRTCDSYPKEYIATIYNKAEAIRIVDLLNIAMRAHPGT